VFVVNSVKTSGKTQDLQAGEFGLFDAKTYSALSAGSISKVNNSSALLAAGSWHSKDSLSTFLGGLKQSVKSGEFLNSGVLSFEYSDPILLSHDIIQIGWDGVNACTSFAFECGKSYFFKIMVEGEDAFRTYSRPIYRIIEVKTECCATGDCTTGCNDTVSPKVYAQQLVDKINSDVELKYFVSAELVSSDYAAPVNTHRLYTLDVNDNGDYAAQAAVASQYQGKVITRVSRNGIVSKYQFCQLITDPAPAAFSNSQTVLQALCGTCPATYTVQAARDSYVIRRPLAGTEDLSTPALRATYATTVGTAYTALTQEFVGQDGAVAIIEIEKTAGAVVTALLSDTVTKKAGTPDLCIPPAATTIAWVAAGDRYKTQRTLCMTLPKKCGAGNRLAELTAAYANVSDIVAASLIVKTAGTCADTYEIKQWNNACLEDGCQSPANATYAELPGFDGISFEACPCPVAAAVVPVNAGVRIKAAYQATTFSDCSFDITDYYTQRPLRLNAAQIDDSGNTCNAKGTKVTVMQRGKSATQTGEWVLRQYLKAANYEAHNSWSNDNRTREVLDQNALKFIKRESLYRIYYFNFLQDRKKLNYSTMHPEERFESIIAVEITNKAAQDAIENVLGSYAALNGVALNQRGTLV
jgi:hypothetical protein